MNLNYWYLTRTNIFFALAEIRGMIDRVAASPHIVPHPSPTIEVMREAWANTYDLALQAKAGDKNFIRKRQEKFEILLKLAVQQMGTIKSVCTETQAQALGFQVGYKKSRKSMPVAPQGVSAKPTGINNSIKVSWVRSFCPGAFGFTVEMTQDNPLLSEPVWKHVPNHFTSRGTITVTNLNNLERYWFRVRAHFSRGVSPYSQPVMGVVL